MDKFVIVTKPSTLRAPKNDAGSSVRHSDTTLTATLAPLLKDGAKPSASALTKHSSILCRTSPTQSLIRTSTSAQITSAQQRLDTSALKVA
ncbi:hypothetical protein A0H81_09887 [Grifola frondosa]|uniref:Uncharacterized protein n=1 Tax=Grifola frondosa TaxID=5627 RepID=A0A1C7M0K1_GRIFR|nr:hypothetical protein A0H81_09887 [Grifola frondosa]